MALLQPMAMESDEEEKQRFDTSRSPEYTLAQLLRLLCRKVTARLLLTFRHQSSSFIDGQWYYTPSDLLPAWSTISTAQPPKLHSTSWLDGLRGVAALIVFFHHASQIWLPGLRPGWGSSPEAHHLFQLPVLRIFYSGGAMVSIFFVISGYVLSSKPLRLALEGHQQELLDNLVSSTFRRGPRLFLPCVVSTFCTAILAMTGAFVDEGVARHYPRAETMFAQLGSWIHETLWFVNPVEGGTGFESNLWTIPTEFQGSLMIFLCALGLSRCRSSIRLGFLGCFILYWLWFGYWALVLFLSGMVLAELRNGQSLKTQIFDESIKRPVDSWQRRTVFGVLGFVALFLLSMPEYDEAVRESLGYSTLSTTLTPESWGNHWGPGRWWPCLSSIMLVTLIDFAGPESILQRPFTGRFPQYLGQISFSLYLCHGVVLYTMGLRIVRCFLKVIGDTTNFRYGCSLLLGATIVIPLLFWISDIFTAVVDRGAVLLSRKMMDL